jgi:hypothetical protein
LAVVFAGRSSGLAHLLLAVALEVHLVHGVGWVAQVLRGRQVRVSRRRIWMADNCSWTAGWCRKICATPNDCSSCGCRRVVEGERGRDCGKGAV